MVGLGFLWANDPIINKEQYFEAMQSIKNPEACARHGMKFSEDESLDFFLTSARWLDLNCMPTYLGL